MLKKSRAGQMDWQASGTIQVAFPWKVGHGQQNTLEEEKK
jgi:hypothetical protein